VHRSAQERRLKESGAQSSWSDAAFRERVGAGRVSHDAMEGTAVNLKTYQAYTMAEALAAVKRDLGADAVILNTRTYRRGGVLGIGRRTIVELTASSNPTTTNGKDTAALRPAARSRVRAAQAYRTTGETTSAGVPGETDGLKTRRLAQAMLEQHDRKRRDASPMPRLNPESAVEGIPGSTPPTDPKTAAAPRTAPQPVAAVSKPADTTARLKEPAAPRETADPAQSVAPSAPATPLVEIDSGNARDQGRVARRFILHAPDDGAGSRADAVSIAPPTGVPMGATIPRLPISLFETKPGDGALDGIASAQDDPSSDPMRDELAAIRSMVGQVLHGQSRQAGGPMPTMPPKLFDMYLTLIGQEVSEELADQIVNDVRDELDGAALEDDAAVGAAVRRHLAGYIPTSDESVLTQSPDGRPLTIALIGPTGVGKTTTLAKLAASFKLRHGRKVGLITADTYRIAAVDQLRTYANIIGLPLKVALTPGEMRQAIHALSDCDVLLIDTAGRSQNDDDRIEELKKFIAAADPHEVHLVLSSTSGEKVLLREAEVFSAIGVHKIVLTKLDEAVSFGMIVNVVRKIGTQLSFFTTGQEVPDHIEVGHPDRIARLVLGEPVHS